MPYFAWEKRPHVEAHSTFASATSKSLGNSKKSLTRKALDFMNPFHHRGGSTSFSRRPSSVLLSSRKNPEPWFSYIERPELTTSRTSTNAARGKVLLKHSISRPFDARRLPNKTPKLGLRNTKSWMGSLGPRSTQHIFDRSALSGASSFDETGSSMNCLKINSGSRPSPTKSHTSPVRIPGRNFADSGTVRRARSMYFQANPLDHIYSAPIMESPLENLMRMESCLEEMLNTIERPPRLPEVQNRRPATLPEFVFPWISKEQLTAIEANNGACATDSVWEGAPCNASIQLSKVLPDRPLIASDRSVTVVGSDRIPSGNSDVAQQRQRLETKLGECMEDDQSSCASSNTDQERQPIENPPCLKAVAEHPPNAQRRHDSGYTSSLGRHSTDKMKNDDTYRLQTASHKLPIEPDVRNSSAFPDGDLQGHKTSSNHVPDRHHIRNSFELAAFEDRLLQWNKDQVAKMLGKTPSPPIPLQRRCGPANLTDIEKIANSAVTDSELADVRSLLFHYPEIDLAFTCPSTPRALISECSATSLEEKTDTLPSTSDSMQDVCQQTPPNLHTPESRSPTRVMFTEITDSVQSRGRQRFREYRGRSPVLTRAQTPESSEFSSPDSPAPVGSHIPSPVPKTPRRSSSID